MRCLRCGGPLGYLDETEGLCSAGDGPNGCFMVFIHTLVTLNLPLPKSRTPAQDREWWRAAYQRIAREGHVTLGVLALFVALVFTGCGPPLPVQCRTTCGTLIVGEPVACADYQRTEDELLARIVGNLPNACKEWNGLTAVSLPGRNSLMRNTDPDDPNYGKEVSVEGWSDCAYRTLYFHSGFPKFWRTAYPHELIHAAQRCDAPKPVDEKRTPAHADWTRHGYAQALSDVELVFLKEEASR